MLHGHSEQQLVESIGFEVTVTLKNGNEVVTGYLYTVDPGSGNVILLVESTIQILMNDLIQTITINRENNIDIDSQLKYQGETPYTQEWLDKRCQQVTKHLQNNHIPLAVKDGVIHLLGCATIESPYAATSVVCENALIRKRVRDLLLDIVQHD